MHAEIVRRAFECFEVSGLLVRKPYSENGGAFFCLLGLRAGRPRLSVPVFREVLAVKIDFAGVRLTRQNARFIRFALPDCKLPLSIAELASVTHSKSSLEKLNQHTLHPLHHEPLNFTAP
jgi:hypothetical protein